MPRTTTYVRRLGVLVAVLLLLASGFAAAAAPAAAVSSTVVISQVYGGGGNIGAPYRNDFVELFNRGATTVSIAGWSVQYASATGTGTFGSNPVTPLSGSLAPGQYCLVQMASGGATGVPLPTPDATGTVSMSATGGKVVLVTTTAGLACNGGSSPCSPEQLALIVDLVGWGTADFFEGAVGPATTNTTAALRNNGGCAETDNNAADFSAGAPNPRNTTSPLNVNAPTVGVSTPTSSQTLTGTATTVGGIACDPGGSVASVAVTIQRSSDGSYWTGSTWSPTQTWLAATGTATWTYDWTFDPASQNGSPTYSIVARATNAVGNTGTSIVSGVTVDNVAPSGLCIAIDDEAAYTASREVDLTLAAAGASQMRFSNDDTTWSDWEDCAAAKAWTLTAGDGAKTVSVQFRDEAGNTAQASAGITLDTVAPVTQSSADGLWHNADVTVTLTAEDGGARVASTYYRLDGGDTEEGTSVLVPAPADHANDGVHVLDYWSVDAAGNTEAPQSCEVKVDTTPPTTSDDASATWHTTAITVGLVATDSGSGVATTRCSLDDGFWLEGSSVLILAEGDHDLQYLSEDNAGNIESVRSVEVRIDWTTPAGTFLLSADAVGTSTLTVSADSAVTDANGVVDMRFSVDGEATWTAWVSYAESIPLTLPSGNGTKWVAAQYRDAAGNLLELSDSIELDAATSILELDAAATIVPYKGTTTLTVDLADAFGTALSGHLVDVQKSLDGVTWTTFTVVASDGGTAVTPALTRATKFRAVWEGAGEYAGAISPVVVVKPKVYLGAPVAPDYIKEDVGFLVYGTLKPQHAVGWNKAVKLYCWRKDPLTGAWVLKKTAWCKTVDYSTYSRYKITIALPSTGSWKLRAFAPEDARHAGTWSTAIYRRVQ